MSFATRAVWALACACWMCACTRSEPAPQRDAAARSDVAVQPQQEPAIEAEPDAGIAPASAAHGAELYARMCAVCHGAEGEGYRADEATALAHPEFLRSVTDEFLTFAIAVGRQGTKMSAWRTDQGGPLSEGDIRDLVAHLRSWQREPPLSLDEGPPRGDAERGAVLFKRTCARCHGAKGPYVRILNRQFLSYATTGMLRRAIRHGRASTKMRGYEKVLGEQGVEDVVAYLGELPSWRIAGEIDGTAKPPPIPLGPVPLNPKGREPKGFRAFPEMTSVDVVGPALQQKARMVLLDARVPSDYALEHIAGAVSVPFYDPFPYLEKLPRDAWLVCYCGCPHAESGALASQLTKAGFKKVTVLDEGLDAWAERGYPMRSGLAP